MAIEIVDLAIAMVIFHSYVSLPEGTGLYHILGRILWGYSLKFSH